jgi:hypothetical protein
MTFDEARQISARKRTITLDFYVKKNCFSSVRTEKSSSMHKTERRNLIKYSGHSVKTQEDHP